MENQNRVHLTKEQFDQIVQYMTDGENDFDYDVEREDIQNFLFDVLNDTSGEGIVGEFVQPDDDLIDDVLSGGEDYWFGEYASNAPGDRSSHLEEHEKTKEKIRQRIV